MTNKDIGQKIDLLTRMFSTFAQQAGYEFDAEGNATRVGKPSGLPVVKEKAKRDPVKMGDYDLSTWPSLPDEQLFNDWRAAKKRNKGSVTQSTMNKVGGELAKAVTNGFNVNDCLATAESSGWRGFESDWMKKADTKVVRRSFMALARGDHLQGLSQTNQPQIAQAPANAIDAFALEYEKGKSKRLSI